MKPICRPCQRFFRPKKNGFAFIEGMPVDNSAYPGTTEPEMWNPYKLWMGDLWVCEGCSAEIIVGTGHSPIAEHYQADFSDKVSAWSGDQFQVNDC